jgi:hypothetical protein
MQRRQEQAAGQKLRLGDCQRALPIIIAASNTDRPTTEDTRHNVGSSGKQSLYDGGGCDCCDPKLALKTRNFRSTLRSFLFNSVWFGLVCVLFE